MSQRPRFPSRPRPPATVSSGRLWSGYIIAPIVAVLVTALGSMAASALAGQPATAGEFSMLLMVSLWFGLPAAYVVEHVLLRIVRFAGADPRTMPRGQVVLATAVAGLVAVPGLHAVMGQASIAPLMLPVGLLTGLAAGVSFTAIRGS